MKNILVVALLCLFSLTLAMAQQTGAAKSEKPKAKPETAATAGGAEAQVAKLEYDFAKAIVKDGNAAVDMYEADDIVSTDPSGRVTTKADEKKDWASGDIKLQAADISDLKVRPYGNSAVATGAIAIKGTYKGQDMSGNYRFTDTWVKRNGKWQVVASQATKVQQ